MINRLFFPAVNIFWRLWDAAVSKRENYWAFPTHHIHTEKFIENPRAIFEHVKADKRIKKIIFFRGDSPDFTLSGGANYLVVKYGTLRSLFILARCKVVFVSHSISMDFSIRWRDGQFRTVKLNMRNRVVVNLWHGIPIKRLLAVANESVGQHTDRNPYRREERKHYSGLVASSDFDSYAMAAMFYPLNYKQVWMTGLPRNDFLRMPERNLPNYIQTSLDRLRNTCGDRRLVIYAPTYRQTAISSSAHYYQFSQAEVEQLRSVLRNHNAILGFRPHYFKNSAEFFNLGEFVDENLIFDMSADVIPEFSALARQCSVLITDYSSVYLETLYLGKPALCFAYDMDNYISEEDGLLYELKTIFAGPICETFAALLMQLEAVLETDQVVCNVQADLVRKIFFKYQDARNSERVTDRLWRRLRKQD